MRRSLHPADMLRRALTPADVPAQPAATNGRAGSGVDASLGYDPRARMPALADPKGVESEVSAKDLKEPPPEPTEGEDEIMRLLERRYKSAQQHQNVQVGEWMECRAMFANKPWFLWDAASWGFKDMRDPDSPRNGRRYTARNLLKGKVLENVARITANTPSVGIRPRNPLPLSVAAAHEARALRSHFDKEFGRPTQLQEMVQESCIFGPPCLKVYFDPSAEDDVPELGADGQVRSVFRAKVGKIREEIVLSTQWLGPNTGHFDTMPWIIHHKPVLVSDVQERFPDKGWAVNGETNISGDVNLETLVASALGEWKYGGEEGKAPQWVMLKEMWEKPSPRYKDGRWMVWANRVLLVNKPWPYERRDIYPFVPLYYIKVQDSLYGLNMLADLTDVQRSINVAMSKLDEHRALPEYNVLIGKGQTLSRGAFRGQGVQMIEYEVGATPPIVTPKPPLSDVILGSITLEQQLLDQISLVNRVSEGQLPNGQMPAAAIQMLQESDQSATKAQMENFHWFLKRVAEIEIALAAQYYTEQRMILMEDDPDAPAATVQPTPVVSAPPDPAQPAPAPGLPAATQPAQAPAPAAAPAQAATVPLDPGQSPAMQPMAFRALTQGGAVAVEIDAESATPRTPAVQLQFVQQLASAGMFQPENLPIAVALLRSIDIYGTDNLADSLEKLLTQQANSQAAMAQDAQKHQHEAQMLALEHAQQEQAAQAAAQQAQVMEAIKTHGEIEIAQAKAQMAMRAASVPKVALSGMLDSTANVAAERAAGLPGDLAEQQATKALPAVQHADQHGLARQQEDNKVADSQTKNALAARGQQIQHEGQQMGHEVQQQTLAQKQEAMRQKGGADAKA